MKHLMKKNKKTISEAQKTFRALKKVFDPDRDLIDLVKKAMPQLSKYHSFPPVMVQSPAPSGKIFGTVYGREVTHKQFAQARREYLHEKGA